VINIDRVRQLQQCFEVFDEMGHIIKDLRLGERLIHSVLIVIISM
jgi:hypothetical protein